LNSFTITYYSIHIEFQLTFTVIEIEEISTFIDGHSKPLVGSREILQCGYLLKVGYVRDCDEEIELKGICIRVLRPGDPPFESTVVIQKPFPGSVVRGHCPCDGGSTGKCKHVIAILRSVEK